MKKIISNSPSFLIISITLIALLVPQPFNDLNRGIIYGIILVYGAIFCTYNIKRIFSNRSWLFWLGIAFYLETTLAYCINGNIMKVGFAHLQYLFIYLAASILNKDDDLTYEFNKLSRIFTVLGIGMALCSYLTMYLKLYYPDFIQTLPSELARMINNSGTLIDNNTRLIGFAINSNLTGNFCALSAILSFYLLIKERSIKWKITSLIDILLCLNIIFLRCASRTAMMLFIAFPLFLLLILLSITKNKKTRKIFKYAILILTTVLLITLIIFTCNKSLRTFFLDRIIRIDTLKSGSGRINLFTKSFAITEGHKLWGINKQVFIDAFGVTSPHNSYLELMVHAGLPAMLLFIAFYISTLVKSGFTLSKISRKDSNITFEVAFLFTYLLIITIHMILDNYMIASYTTIGMFGHYALGTVIALDENRKATENPQSF